MNGPIVITRSKLVAMQWKTQGQIRGGPIEPHPEVFHLWHEGALLGFASEINAALLLAEHYAKRFGCEVDDATLETSPLADRIDWPAAPHG